MAHSSRAGHESPLRQSLARCAGSKLSAGELLQGESRPNLKQPQPHRKVLGKGGRVRQGGFILVSDGNGPICRFHADRTLIPAVAAAVSWVFPPIRLCLNNATCLSVINPEPP